MMICVPFTGVTMPLVGYLPKFRRKSQISIFLITIGAIFTIVVYDFGKISTTEQPQVEYESATLYPSVHRYTNVTSDNIILEKKSVKAKTPLLDEVLPVPKVTTSCLVPPLTDELMKSKLRYPRRSYTEQILILTPVHDVTKEIPHFIELLKALTYPHHLITIVFGEDSSEDNTFNVTKKIVNKYQSEFKGMRVVHFNITGAAHGTWSEIHNEHKQLARRTHLAEARNLLLKTTLRNESWVLWIDIIKSFPVDIIQQLLSAQRDIVAPLCLYSYESDDAKYVYDRNTWRETSESLEYQKHLDKDQIMLEGYDETRRIYLHDLRAEGRVVPIDGVGGCCLLIRANCHKKGLLFPTKLYKHHIETEGLAKMAADMQFTIGGMPFVEAFHN